MRLKPTTWVECPSCGLVRELRRDGKLRRHRLAPFFKGCFHCPGSEQPPRLDAKRLDHKPDRVWLDGQGWTSAL